MKTLAFNAFEDQGRVMRFFDRLAPDYGERYGGKDRFHDHFFQERLTKAIRGLDLSDRDVLDIGSGTGDLYAKLITRFPDMRFIATDVSAGMLAKSKVPASQRLLGHAYDHAMGDRRFHAIFMLGVSTYMDRQELEKNLAFAARHLAPGGTFTATFTNKHALDSWTRALARWPLRLFSRGDHVLTSDLRIHRYSFRETRSIVERHFTIKGWDLLNHTIFPANHLLPDASIRLARGLSDRKGTAAWLRFLSSDLMVHAESRYSPPETLGTEGNQAHPERLSKAAPGPNE